MNWVSGRVEIMADEISKCFAFWADNLWGELKLINKKISINRSLNQKEEPFC